MLVRLLDSKELLLEATSTILVAFAHDLRALFEV